VLSTPAFASPAVLSVPAIVAAAAAFFLAFLVFLFFFALPVTAVAVVAVVVSSSAASSLSPCANASVSAIRFLFLEFLLRAAAAVVVTELSAVPLLLVKHVNLYASQTQIVHIGIVVSAKAAHFFEKQCANNYTHIMTQAAV
jgi:hypothetical protein